MGESITDSQFYMWRAVVAMAHADGVVTPHELSFINDYLLDLNLSKGQLQIIGEDLREDKDVYDMFSHISDRQDQKDFFALARALSWCDGDLDAQEAQIIKRLEAIHMNDETRSVLEESRDEVELSDNQWVFKAERNTSIFGFLDKIRSA